MKTLHQDRTCAITAFRDHRGNRVLKFWHASGCWHELHATTDDDARRVLSQLAEVWGFELGPLLHLDPAVQP